MALRLQRSIVLVIFSLVLSCLFIDAAISDVAYIIKEPSGDRGVSVTFSYDLEAEAAILEKIKGDGHILIWKIRSEEKYVFYRPFEFAQGRFSVRPVLCLVEKFECRSSRGKEGFVYQGYLFLESVFDLKSPFNITLADKTIQATFLQ